MSLSLRPLPSLLLLVLLGTCSVALAGPQSQDSRDPVSSASDLPRPHRVAPPPLQEQRAPMRNEDALSDSVRKIERSKRGQVLSAERVPYEGRNLNRIKVIDDRGRVRVYMDDPQQPPPPARAPTRGDDD